MSGDARDGPATASACRVHLRFEDGAAREIEIASGELILDAALRQAVPLIHQCRSGSCGTCVARLVDGMVEMLHDRALSLMPYEIAEGRRLTCSAYALSDSTLALDYPGALIFGGDPREAPHRSTLAATVRAIEWPAESVARLVLELDRDSEFSFHAGQYVRLRIPGTDQWRSYSMATTARDLPAMEFFVRFILGGAMSEYLRTRARPGDTIEIEGPLGAFVLRPGAAPHIFVAGGTGLAPILSMIDAIRRQPGRRPPLLLCFGSGSEATLFARDELELRQWWMPSLEVRLSAGRIDNWSSGILKGTPVDALREGDARDPASAAYVCGPPGMIEAARRRLAAIGVAPERIYVEQFRPSIIGDAQSHTLQPNAALAPK